MSTEEWRERALAAEGELARLRSSLGQPAWIDTAVDRARREADRRRTAPTETMLPVLPPCAPNCPCGVCCDARPEPEPQAFTPPCGHRFLCLCPKG